MTWTNRLDISGHTQLLAFFADPASHSFSPRMHTLAAQYLGLDYVYLAFRVNESTIGDAVAAMRTLDARGFNLSMPNKSAVLEHVDEQSEAVQLIGAANTVVNHVGHLSAHNTDGVGAMNALRLNGVDPRGSRITIIGTGGSGSAIAIQAGLDEAAHINLVNRKSGAWQRSVSLLNRVQSTGASVSLTDLDDRGAVNTVLATSDVVIDATNVGMADLAGQSNISDYSVLQPHVLVMDLVYHPAQTRLIKECEAAGIKAINGEEMLFQQGAVAFKLWTGHDMPLEYIKQNVVV